MKENELESLFWTENFSFFLKARKDSCLSLPVSLVFRGESRSGANKDGIECKFLEKGEEGRE